MVLGDDKVVHHAGIGRLETFEARRLAGGVDRSVGEGRRQRTRGVVAEEHELAGDRVDLRMRREAAGDATLIIVIAARCQRARLDLGRQMRFFQREQLAGMKDDVGVGDAAVGEVLRGIRQLAAEAAEQRAACIVLGQPFRRADPAVAIAGAAVLEVEGVQHAVADEPVRTRRIELRIGTVAIEHAIQIARQFPDDFEEWRIGFEWNRTEVVAALGDGVVLHGVSLPIFTS